MRAWRTLLVSIAAGCALTVASSWVLTYLPRVQSTAASPRSYSVFRRAKQEVWHGQLWTMIGWEMRDVGLVRRTVMHVYPPRPGDPTGDDTGRLGWSDGEFVFAEEQYGWPLPAMASWWVYNGPPDTYMFWESLPDELLNDYWNPKPKEAGGSGPSLRAGFGVSGWRNPKQVSNWGVIPCIPCMPGFAVDAALYSTVVFLLVHAKAVVSRLVRRRRKVPGACDVCGYPLGEGRCPECGTSAAVRPQGCESTGTGE